MARTKAEQREALLKMSAEELEARHITKCPRCGGSGHYSYNAIYGTMCFKCQGIGFIRKITTRKA